MLLPRQEVSNEELNEKLFLLSSKLSIFRHNFGFSLQHTNYLHENVINCAFSVVAQVKRKFYWNAPIIRPYDSFRNHVNGPHNLMTPTNAR